MKKNKFISTLIIFTAACAALAAAFLIYVYSVVSNYDRVQPERAVQSEIERLKNAADKNGLSEKIDFAGFYNSRYETMDIEEISAGYAEKFCGDITFSAISAESGELVKTYAVYSDGENIGKMVLEGSDPRTELFFFSSADWRIKSFEPRIADIIYNFKLYCPENVKVSINGVSPEKTNEFTLDGIPVYSISGLLSEPEIVYRRQDGTEIPYSVENNTIKPLIYHYTFELPAGINVRSGGKILSAAPHGDKLSYTVGDMTEPEIKLSDILGNTVSYSVQEELPLHRYSAVIPESCRLYIGGKDADGVLEAAQSENPDAAQLLKLTGITLPALKKYDFCLFADSAALTVADESGSRDITLESGGSLELFSFGSENGIPAGTAAEIDVMEVGKTWSRFMTDDIGGEMHGFNTVAQYLIDGSDYYIHAREWATGIDITFMSTHTLDSFSGERISDFVSYGDCCFSCNVYFEKNMTLYYEGRYVGSRTDVFSNIMYFVKVSDGSWRLALMHDINMKEGDGDEQ